MGFKDFPQLRLSLKRHLAYLRNTVYIMITVGRHFENEDKLMANFRKGNEEAFRHIFDRMVRPLAIFADDIIDNRHCSENIVGHAFSALYHSRHQMNTLDELKKWLYVAVRKAIINYCKEHKSTDDINIPISMPLGDLQAIQMAELKSFHLLDILECIQSLPFQIGSVMRLYYFESKSEFEICWQLGITHDLVIKRKLRGLHMLKRQGIKL